MLANLLYSGTFDSPAADRTECGKRINALVKNIKKFEEISGFLSINAAPFFEEDNFWKHVIVEQRLLQQNSSVPTCKFNKIFLSIITSSYRNHILLSTEILQVASLSQHETLRVIKYTRRRTLEALLLHTLKPSYLEFRVKNFLVLNESLDKVCII